MMVSSNGSIFYIMSEDILSHIFYMGYIENMTSFNMTDDISGQIFHILVDGTPWTYIIDYIENLT